MADHLVPIPAESSPLTEEDKRKYERVKDLIESENKAVLDFAKLLATVSFSAIGVVVAFKDKWLGAGASPRSAWLLGLAIVLFLVSAALSLAAVSAQAHRVSLADYAGVDEEMHRTATRRYWLTVSGFTVSLVAILIVATVALGYA